MSPDPLVPNPLFKGETAVIEAVAREMGNPDWGESSAHILIVRLSPWRDVNISTPHLVLYEEVRTALPQSYIDFAFLPSRQDRSEAVRRGIPWFSGRSSGRAPADFDLVMISNATALELLNVPVLLANSGFPVSAREREELATGKEGLPLIILGGSNASASGALVEFDGDRPGARVLDSLVDGIFFGDGEEAIGPLAKILVDSAARPPRAGRLAKAAEIRGFWPCLHASSAEKSRFRSAPRSLLSPLVLNGPEAATTRLSLTAGCPGFCSFCLEGWDRRPYREAPLQSLVESARTLKSRTGAEEVELYSFNFNTHEKIFQVIFELNRIFDKVSFMSQRLDLLADTPHLFEVERAAGKRGFTLGVEGISARLRAFYRKGLEDDQLSSCLEGSLVSGVKELKLFFIIAGMENDEDLADFESMLSTVSDLKRDRNLGTRVVVSAGYLVRLPFTPLQFAPLVLDEKILSSVAGKMAGACARQGVEFRLAASYGEFYVDQMLSLGAPGIHAWLKSLSGGEMLYDGTIPHTAAKALGTFLAASATEASATGAREAMRAFMAEKDSSYRPPFGFIEPEKHHRALHKNYLAASSFTDRKSCLGSACSNCGACADPDEIASMTDHANPSVPEPEFASKISRLLVAKRDFTPIEVLLEIPRALSMATPAYRHAWVSRTLFSSRKGADRLVFRVRDALFDEDGRLAEFFGSGIPWSGQTIYRIYGPDPERLKRIVTVNSEGSTGWDRMNPRLVSSRDSADSGFGPSGSGTSEGYSIICPLLPGSGASIQPARKSFESYLAGQGIACTTRRNGAGLEYDMGSRGRKILLSASLNSGSPLGQRLRTAPEGMVLHIVAGDKFSARPLWTSLVESGVADESCGGFQVSL